MKIEPIFCRAELNRGLRYVVHPRLETQNSTKYTLTAFKYSVKHKVCTVSALIYVNKELKEGTGEGRTAVTRPSSLQTAPVHCLRVKHEGRDEGRS